MKQIVYLVLSLIIFESCASISTLSGGKADEAPPLLQKSNITSTNFKDDVIELNFDEYIETNEVNQNIKIYPEHTTFKVSVHKKKVIIKLDSALHDNTSYYLWINKGIKDVHAGNSFDYKKVFSTGNSIDTNYVKIQVPNYRKYKNLKIALLEELPKDSLRVIQKSYVYALKSEINEFFALKNKNYHIWVYTDANSDGQIDWYQPLNFTNNIRTDTTYILDVKAWNKPFEIKTIKTDGVYSKIYYAHDPHYFYHLQDILGNQLENTIYSNEDSTLIKDLKLNFTKETIQNINVKKELDAVVMKELEIIHMKKNYTVIYNKPQFYTEYKNFRKLEKDKTIYNTKPEFIQIYVPQEERMDTFNIKNITPKEHSKLAYFEFEINDKFNQLYDVKIKKNGEEIISLVDVKKQDFYLDPGSYKIEVFKRSFTNEFNPFEFKNESSLIYAKDLILKASWDEILSISPQ